ncbi:PBSX phage terminase small subunit [Ruegeria sp. TM1040]|uniref:terminase small subunit n=1 Tax=Ruegeria sp. (strain TM1040) TaxID=292414 RepID=UPI0000462670|nr:terminase small subunit [Ruegeria sp. TM1040]ABF63533.1 PBSX phage terminase small subunit [Ruegeria sp. TM1040]
MALTAKQERFVAEYLIDLNATQAAIRAGYSAKTAYSVGHENLKKPEIAKAIQEANSKRSERTEITQDRVLQEFARIGFADIRKAVAWGSTPADLLEGDEGGDEGTPASVYPVDLVRSSEVDDDTAAAIAEVSLTKGGVKLKMHDKLSALEKLARHLGMLNGSGAGDDDAPSLTININSKEPVGDVRVTRSDG